MTLLPPSLTERVPGPEAMDDLESIGGEELRTALTTLRTINRRLGGHATTRRALSDLAARTALPRRLEVLDVGGGSGDAAPEILAWGRERAFDVRVVVLDLHPETAAEAASLLHREPQAEARQGDLFDVPPRSFDVVHAGLFLHHFDGDGAGRALAAMARAARHGVVVNDLHRHAVPWVLIRALTLVGSRNRLIRNDAPLSVARGFTDRDWRALGPAAGLDLRWRRTWAWRWAVSGVPVR